MLATLANMTASRSSAATDGVPVVGRNDTTNTGAYYDGCGIASTEIVNHFASGEAVTANFAGHTWVLCEPSFTNYCLESEGVEGTPWTASNMGTKTADDATAPDGTVTADLLTWNAGNSAMIQDISGEPTDVKFHFSVYAKPVDNSTDAELSIQIVGQNGSNNRPNWDAPLRNRWQKYTMARLNGVGGAAAKNRIRNNSGGSSNDPVWFWGASFVPETATRQHNMSYVPTAGVTVTRAADAHTWAAGGTNYDQGMLSETWAFKFVPEWSEVENDETDDCFFAFDDSSTPKMRVRWNGSTRKIDVLNDAQTTVASSNALTFSPGQHITVILYPADGDIEVRGATTGDGTVSGTAWTVGGDYTLGIGHDPTAGGSCPGAWISLPYIPA